VSRVIVIGYGNPSRRDDGVAHYVLEKLQDLADDRLELIACHQLGIELAETIKDYDLVIFVDACVGDREEELKITAVQSGYTPSAFTHFLKPGSLLALTESLYDKQPRAFIFSIKGHDFDFGTELSEETQKWANDAVEKILDIVSF
jgi:hydrogenase maturation protease